MARLVRLGAIPDERRGALARAVAERDEMIVRQSEIIHRQKGLLEDCTLRIAMLECQALVAKPTPAPVAEPDLVPDASGELDVKIRVDDIVLAVCARYQISRVDLMSQRRQRSYAWPRQVAIYLARRLTILALPAIGRIFGDRDHTTILHAHRKIDALIETNEDLRGTVDKLILDIRVRSVRRMAVP